MRCVCALRSGWLAWVLLFVCAGDAAASVSASVDHDRVAVGGTVVLSILSDGNAAPDFAPLSADFDLQGRSTSSQTSIVNGRVTSQQTWTIALSPRHSGALRIPALTVGAEHTDPIALSVTGQPTPVAGSGAPVFIQTALDAENPYVQQSVIYTVRLYYAVTLLDGSLDTPPSDGIDLRQLGDDTQGSAMVGGRRYNVLERRYLLTPERSGSLQLPTPGFRGRAVGDGFDGMFGGTAVAASGQPKTLVVRARPAQAADPWLPAQAITLSVDPPAAPLRAGEPFTLTVKLSGTGVTAAQLPDPQLPQIAGAQVYPEASSFQDSVRNGGLFATRTRRFAIVASAAGTLQIPPIVQSWWDVRNDRAAQARAVVPSMQVLPGTGATASIDTTTAASGAAPALTSDRGPSTREWQSIAILLVLGWIITALWGWRRGRNVTRIDTDAPTHARKLDPTVPRRGPTLMRALALGELEAIACALLDAAPGVRAQHLADVAQRLDNPVQRAAVQALDAARWGSGDAATALAQLRAAFADPPRWCDQRVIDRNDNALPPLYPR